MPTIDWNAPAEVRWNQLMAVDQIDAEGEGTRSRAFASTREALRFVMEELKPPASAMVGVYPERGSAFINLAEIERAYRSGPHDVDEPGGMA